MKKLQQHGKMVDIDIGQNMYLIQSKLIFVTVYLLHIVFFENVCLVVCVFVNRQIIFLIQLNKVIIIYCWAFIVFYCLFNSYGVCKSVCVGKILFNLYIYFGCMHFIYTFRKNVLYHICLQAPAVYYHFIIIVQCIIILSREFY